MWTEKTSDEIRIIKAEWESKTQRFNFPISMKRFVRSFFIVFTILCLLALIIDPLPSSYNPEYKSIPISELPDYLGFYAIAAFVFGLYRFYLSFFHPEFFVRKSSSTFICSRCLQTKTISDTQICTCGGSLENLQHYKWVEDKKMVVQDGEAWIEEYKVMKPGIR